MTAERADLNQQKLKMKVKHLQIDIDDEDERKGGALNQKKGHKVEQSEDQKRNDINGAASKDDEADESKFRSQ